MTAFAPPSILVRREPVCLSNHNPPQQSLETPDDGVKRRSVTAANVRVVFEYRPESRSRLSLFDGWWLYLSTPVAWDVYAELNELLAQASAFGLQRTLDQLEHLRLSAFIAFDERVGTLHFGRSMDGLCSLFFATRDESLLVSSSRFAIGDSIGGAKPDQSDLNAWGTQGSVDPESSFVEGVKRCFAGVRYTIGISATTNDYKKTLMAPGANLVEQDEGVRLLGDSLMTLFARYRNHRVALRLSGGVDSRVLLVGLMQAVRIGVLRKEQILCVSVLFSGLPCDESAEIRQIVALSGFAWAGIDVTRGIAHRAHMECIQQDAPPFPTSYFGMLCNQKALALGFDTVISGHGGDELFSSQRDDIQALPLLTRLRLAKTMGQTPTLRGALNLIALATLGDSSAFGVGRSCRTDGLFRPNSPRHRLGRRLILAAGFGYEAMSVGCTTYGLSCDTPLLRSPMWERTNPVLSKLNSGALPKWAARQYIRSVSPAVDDVPYKKALFYGALELLLPKLLAQREIYLDPRHAFRYFQRMSMDQWYSAAFHRHNEV